MHQIAKDVRRSPNTVIRYIHDHNDEIRLRGYCIKCRRIKHKFSTTET